MYFLVLTVLLKKYIFLEFEAAGVNSQIAPSSQSKFVGICQECFIVCGVIMLQVSTSLTRVVFPLSLLSFVPFSNLDGVQIRGRAKIPLFLYLH